MRKGSITVIAAAGIFGSSLVLGADTSLAETDTPKYGGTLEVGTVYVTLTALSWDAQDFNWKHNHDTGQFYEQLFAADLSKSVKNDGPHPFYADAWLPSDAIRGELAESWEWKENPLRVEIKLRKGDHVSREAGRDGLARAGRRRCRVLLQPARQQPAQAQGLLQPRRQGGSDRQAHGGLHL